MNREDYNPTPYEIIRNHIQTIYECKEFGGIINLDDEVVKVLAMANDVRNDLIDSLQIKD